MRFSFHPGPLQLALLFLALLCPFPRPVTLLPRSPTALLPTVNSPELESALLHLQAGLGNPMEAWWPQDARRALPHPKEEEDEEGEEGVEDGSWKEKEEEEEEEETLLRAQREDLMAQPLSPFPGGHSMESLYYQDGGEGEGEDGWKRNNALTSMAGGLQAAGREKGGFVFRFGRKRWTDGGGHEEEDGWRQ